ncbi:cation-dependent mannose-6-phosphate receptor-like [Liolophura sinensis]|uniref:cation-dependent mannose-6-phosphate receptor-like n=1 Tax=Liolophura sinensis TaxID=3198878 RepID=UPI0031598B8D
MALGVTRSLLADGAMLRRMMWILMALVTFCMSLTSADTEPQCAFPNHKTPPNLSNIKPLMGQRFRVEDENKEYTYDIGICTTAVADKDFSEAGILQTETATHKIHIIGKFKSSEVRIGTDWAMLEYRHGDQYKHHCKNGSERVAVIMITCDPRVQAISDVKPVLLAEENSKNAECYYLFEMSHSCVCTDIAKPLMSFSLSIGSIVVIVFMTLCGVYLLGGVLYNRFVLGAKGMEQIPNYSFWLDFGNLQADGCNLVCRTRSVSRSYKGIGDDQLAETEDDRDDHLLPM